MTAVCDVCLTELPKLVVKPDKYRHVSAMPGMMFGQPCAGPSRVPAEQVAEMWWSGWTLDELADSWPPSPDHPYAGLDRGQVLVCCWYMAMHSRPRRWKARWAEWAKVNALTLWRSDWETCPMPPQEANVTQQEEG